MSTVLLYIVALVFALSTLRSKTKDSLAIAAVFIALGSIWITDLTPTQLKIAVIVAVSTIVVMLISFLKR